MQRRALLSACLVLAVASSAYAQSQPARDEKAKLPKVVMVGDSIRLGYAPLVAKRLAGKADVISPPANGGDSANVLKHLDAWVLRENPDVVHLNCGLHDLKVTKTDKQYQVDLAQYENNLKQIVTRIREGTSAAIVFANTTPILDGRHAKRKAAFDRFEADVQRYNTAAVTLMKELNVPVHDLHWVVEQGGSEKLLGADGTHYTPAGYERLAAAVADCVSRQLTVRRAKPSPLPTRNPQAAAEYRKTEAERDGLVPRAYRQLPVGEFHVPENAAAWKAQRPDVLRKVVQSLGDLPPRPAPAKVRQVSREIRLGYTLEAVAIDNGVDGEVTALLLVPEKRQKLAPAVLWLHSSSPDKTQIITPQTNGGKEPLGEVLVRAGYVVLALTPTGTATERAPARPGERRPTVPSMTASSSCTCGLAELCGACSSVTTKSLWTTSARGRKWTRPASAPRA